MNLRSAAGRIRSAVLAVACCSLSLSPMAAPPAARADLRTPALAITARQLANGMRVVVVEDRSVAVVQTALYYRFGAGDETAGRTGLAHALEHMMYRGTKTLSEAGLQDALQQFGAESNATTSNDYTHYYFVLPADKLDVALRIEADRMQNLALRDADWRAEKNAVLAEYDSDLSQPLSKLYDGVCRAAANVPLCSLSSLGSRGDITAATAADLRSYYQTWYAPNNATLVITGDVDTAKAFDLVNHRFGLIPARRLPARATVAPVYSNGKTVSVTATFPYDVVDIAFGAPGSLDDRGPAMQILDAVIDAQSSPFQKDLVSSGILLGYSTQYDQNLHGGLYHVFLIVAPGHTSDEAKNAFDATLRKTIAAGFPADLVDAAKHTVATNSIYARDSVAGLGDRIGFTVGVEEESDPAQDDARIAAVRPLDVADAAARYVEVPAAIGELIPSRAQQSEAPPPPPSTGVSDDFTHRPAVGPIVQPAWLLASLAQPLGIGSKIRPNFFTLPDGVRVFVQEVHQNPTVFINGAIETSPRSDPIGKEGLGAMVSSLMNYGSTAADFETQRKQLDALDATMDLGFQFDAHGLSQDLPSIAKLLASGLSAPRFDPVYVDLVRKQTLAAVQRRDTDDAYRSTRAFEELMLAPDDPTLREPTRQSIASITTADLRAYADRFLRPDLTSISVVGDVDPAAVRQIFKEAFASWKATGEAPDVSSPPIPQRSAAERRTLTADRVDVDVHLGQPAPLRGTADFYPLSLLNEILGADGAFDSRLVRDLRFQQNLVYEIASSYDSDRFRGTLNVRFRAGLPNAQRAIGGVESEFMRLQNEPVPDAELARAKTKIAAQALVTEEATDVVAARVENIAANYLRADFYVTLGGRYAALSAADVQRVARTYLHPNNLVEVLEGPRQ